MKSEEKIEAKADVIGEEYNSNQVMWWIAGNGEEEKMSERRITDCQVIVGMEKFLKWRKFWKKIFENEIWREDWS